MPRLMKLTMILRLFEPVNSEVRVAQIPGGSWDGKLTHYGSISFGTVRAFGSASGPGRWTYGGDISPGAVRVFGSGRRPERLNYGG